MKVSIVTTRHGAQDDRIYYKQALSLAKFLDVTMIAPDDGEDLAWDKGVRYRPIPRRRSIIGRLLSVVEASIAVRREAPDFCHLHDLDLALTVPFIRLITNAKIIYDSHEVFTRDDLFMGSRLPESLRRVIARIVEAAENSLVMVAHHVVTAVDPAGRTFRKLLTPMTTVFNYPPLFMFETDSRKVETAEKKYAGRLPILYQGTMSIDRGLIDMIDAVALVKKREPLILLRLIGMIDPALKSRAEERLVQLELQENVEISGWQRHDQICLAMKTSLMGLVPLKSNEKYNHALPIKLLEYMACGLAVVASSLTLVSKYVEDSGAGALYDPARPEELARCILKLLEDPERRAKMGEAGQRAVREKWNWGRMEEILWRVYQSLGAQPRACE